MKIRAILYPLGLLIFAFSALNAPGQTPAPTPEPLPKIAPLDKSAIAPAKKPEFENVLPEPTRGPGDRIGDGGGRAR
jgi:hypothetical protein